MRIIPSQDIPSIVHMVRPLRAATRPSMWLGMVLAAAMFCAGCATVPPQGPQGRAAQVTELLREANDSQGDPAQTIGRYLNVVETALALATDRTASSEDRTKGMHVYNAAVADFVTVLQKQNILPDGAAPGTFPGAGATYALQVISDGKSSVKNPAAFTRLIESGKISRGHMEADVRRAGLGATFVGVIDSSESVPHRSPKGFAEPLTAIAAFQKPVDGITPVKLFLFDPRTKEKVTLNDSTFVLNADFTAPLAYFPKRHELIFGIAAMLRVDRVASRSGIYFVEPFDPHKIPVLFVHGLMSSPTHGFSLLTS